MALVLNAAQIGVPVFQTIVLDPESIASVIRPYLIVGLTRNRLTIEDLHPDVLSNDGNIAPGTVTEAVTRGMPIFDAIAYFALPVNQRPAFNFLDALPDGRTANLVDVAEGLAYFYFFLMVRANVPRGAASNLNADVPNFLRTVLGLNQARDVYVSMIAGFDLSKIEHMWIRNIEVPPLPSAARSRLSLGVAGYRLFSPFRFYAVRQGASAQATNAYNIVRAYTDQGVSWDIHPITRNMNLLGRTGPLNANLGNLILECFTEAEITEMIELKMIFQRPVRDPKSMHWRNWNETTFGAIQNPINL